MTPAEGCIHPIDRGSQYRSNVYQKILRQHGFKMSPLVECMHSPAGQRMSSKGNCYDYAAVETFFKTIEAELLWQRS